MKILIGGSPCTHWSIAQTKNRETEASGIGWELFLNYRIARDKYHPDYFLYENNKSMSPAIRAQITAELGVEPVLINSALVSAQNRQRLYWVGKREPDGHIQPSPCGTAGGQGYPAAGYFGKRCCDVARESVHIESECGDKTGCVKCFATHRNEWAFWLYGRGGASQHDSGR